MGVFGRLARRKQSSTTQPKAPQEEAARGTEPSAAEDERNPIADGMVTLKDILAPGGVDRSDPDVLRVGPMWARTLVITGLPSQISIGWLQPFLEHDGHLDLSLQIEPYEERAALAYLTKLITRLKAEWTFVAQITGISDDIAKATSDAERIRDLIATNQSRLFRLTTLATVYDQDKERVVEAANMLDGRLAARRIYTKGLETRQDEAYISSLPLGLNLCSDVGRNLDTFALGTAMPFTDADLVMPGGFQLGINMHTQAPVIINPYKWNNHNMVVYATSGSGKSATVKSMVGRALFTGEVAAVLDPEGEYSLMAHVLGGVVVPLGPGSDYFLNPFEVSVEEDEEGRRYIDLRTKIIDLVELIRTMVGVPVSPDQEAIETATIEWALRETYNQFGISEDPNSLYEAGGAKVSDTGDITYGRQPKRMPTLSDFREVLGKAGERGRRVYEALSPYVQGGVMDFFDHQSNVVIDGMPVVVFDVHHLDERWGKPVALQVCLNWLWHQFVSKRPKQKKRVVVDEAWLLASYDSAMRFLENMVRRARKRTAGITVISQDFRKFALHPMGQAIHSNSAAYIFLRAEDVDLDDIQRTFKLSDGERAFIAEAGKGEGILRVGHRTIPFKVLHTPSEQQWVYTTPLREAATP